MYILEFSGNVEAKGVFDLYNTGPLRYTQWLLGGGGFRRIPLQQTKIFLT